MKKSKIKILLLILTIMYSIYAIHFFVKNDMWVTFQDCGEVVGSSSEDRPIKHGTQTDLYLLIKYDKQGFKAQEVGPTTYFQYKDNIGQRLCFDQTKRNVLMENPLNIIHFFLGTVSLIIYFFIILFIFVEWLTNDKK